MITTERHGDITVLRLAHGKANAIDVALFEALTACVAAERTSATRAVVLTGTGSMFSAGVDLVQVLGGGAAYVRRFMPVLHATLETLFMFPKPLVAAINGHAIAGGCVLACAADHRLMSAGRIGVPELLVGVPFPSLALEVMRQAVGSAQLPELVYGGQTFTPQEARERGLVHAVVDPDALLASAVAAAERLAAIAPDAFALTKRQLHGAAIDRVRADGARFEAQVMASWESDATQARIRAYVERVLSR